MLEMWLRSADSIWVQSDLLTLFLARSTLGLVKARRHLTRSPVVSLASLPQLDTSSPAQRDAQAPVAPLIS